jgi:hypothetical protein
VIIAHHQVHFNIPYALPELKNSGSVCSTPQKHRQWLSAIFETPKLHKHENHS